MVLWGRSMNEAEARIGTRLGNYILAEIIGRGGMGVVYRAEHAYIHKPVAVKVLHRHHFDQPAAREAFLREAQAAGVIDHPNIVGVTDFGEVPDGTVFLVMAYVAGTSLDRILRAEGRLPLFRALGILSQVARALGATHEKGIVHQDLKPENIMLEPRPGRREIVRTVQDEHGTLELVEPEGQYDFVTVLDFGAARFFDQSAAQLKVLTGTPMYMAPETARSGSADARSDIYAAGVVLFQMLTGKVPFDGESAVDIMFKQVHDPVPSLRLRCPEAELTPEAERAILKALEKDPNRRYQTMAEFHADLQRCYGSVRFRRHLHNLPPGVSVESLRKPLPLTKVKRRAPSAAAQGAGVTPTAEAKEGEGATTTAPLPLTKRKSGRKTLSFGPGPAPSSAPRSGRRTSTKTRTPGG
jgi:eukaryotic-like serine/threonine-protein kinase